jgi:(E)-4-hydroxy-3-methylbut-2-enyl-diphosphate synthase
MSHNPIRPWRNIDRRKTRQIHVGPVPVGGDAPITVQTMTNTLTTDVKATVEQVQACAEAGADIVRISVPDEASSRALKEIVPRKPGAHRGRHPFPLQTRDRGGRGGAACLRINPGNIGDEKRVREVIKAARDHGCSDPDRRECRQPRKAPAGQIRRALSRRDGRIRLDHIRILEDNDFHDFKIS